MAMNLANQYQVMGVDRDHTLVLSGPAGSTSTHVLSTLCMDSHLKSPPPTTPVVGDTGDSLEYSVSISPLLPILDVVSSLKPQLVELAAHLGMPENMYVDTVTQWSIWVAVGADSAWPFNRDIAEALLGAALAAAGRPIKDEERQKCVAVLWQGVDLTLKTAASINPRFANSGWPR
jgi:hypothetical protein